MTDKSTITYVGLVLALLLALGFGIQQCNRNAITQGDLKARADTLSYWKDQAGTEHARIGQLVTSQAFVQKMLDSLKTIKGSKTTAVTHIGISGNEVLVYDLHGWIDNSVGHDTSLHGWIDSVDNLVGHDTSEYQVTASDTLAWLRASTRLYRNKYDTIEVSWDSAILHIHDNLIMVESDSKRGGLFNRELVHNVDVYHENPRFKTDKLQSWKLAVPIRHWVAGPSINLYPKFDNGIKLGVSAGVSVTYDFIHF